METNPPSENPAADRGTEANVAPPASPAQQPMVVIQQPVPSWAGSLVWLDGVDAYWRWQFR